MKIIVAIDGFAASGKSTIAQDLAGKTGYTHNNTKSTGSHPLSAGYN